MRDNWLDQARGIGILLVVLGHVNRGIFASGLPLDSNNFAIIDDGIYAFHMPLFFFISGTLFKNSLLKYNSGQFFASKFRTLAYPYVIWSLIQGLIEVAMGNWTNNQTSLSSIFSLLWQPRAQFWFLYALIITLMIALFLYKIVPIRLHLLIAIGALTLHLFRDNPALPSPLRVQASYFIYFCLGAELAPLLRKVKNNANALNIASFFAVMFFAAGELILSYHWLASAPPINAFIFAMISIAAVLLVSMQIERKALFCGALSYLGANSMSIYLTHIIFAAGTRIVLVKAFHFEDPYIHMALGLIAGITLPIYLEKASKKIGASWLFKAPDWLFPLPNVKADSVK